MAFQEIYADVNIENGGLFFDPEIRDVIEVIDLDSASGVGGTNLLIKGSLFINDEGIRKGLQTIGQEGETERLLQSAKVWDEAPSFAVLPQNVKADVFKIAEAVHAYSGMDGGPDKATLVISEGEGYTREQIDELEGQWGADSIVTNSPDTTIWSVLTSPAWDVSRSAVPVGESEGWWDWRPSRGALGPVGPELDEFAKAYLIAALWSSTDEEGNPLDDEHTIENIARETHNEMVFDAEKFYRENEADIEDDPSRAGHDFWLTRNGHGAGFWDGDWPEPAATRLTKASEAFGAYNLYIGDDGKIYGMEG